MASENFDRGGLRFGFWMQFWASVYALTTVYPNPGLTSLVVAVLGVLAALIYDSRPAAWGGPA
ncbi:hypothetical protein [Halobacterium sp. KA-6]|uniref:hypothetical protein n=1 Tax=Halobacterium sp. KA-6 TaxID=2896368 RepID=UPI001E35C299|nr:hypothetical protein [Halobacterium sp. KA-6]MCD2205305.1 hypothetical protein [Halobacterium sp. KA-6]